MQDLNCRLERFAALMTGLSLLSATWGVAAAVIEPGGQRLVVSPTLTLQDDAKGVSRLPATPLGSITPRPDALSGLPRVRLRELANQALRTQPLVMSADARSRADFEKVEQARTLLAPSVAGTLTLRREFENSGTTVPFQSLAAGAQTTVPIYRPQASANVNVAQFQFEATRSARFETERDLLAALSTAYVAAGQFEAETSLLQAERDGLATQRALNQRRMEGGIGTLVEVLETAARLEFLQAQIRGSQGAESLQLAELARLANGSLARVSRLGERVPGLIVPALRERALMQARERNATLVRLKLAADSARANLVAQRAGSSPAVDLVGNLDRSSLEVNGVRSQVPSALIGLRLSVPLFTAGLVDSRVREAQALIERADADLQDAELTLRADVAKAYADLARAQDQLEANLGALAIANRSLKATIKAFDAGVRGNIDVLNAQQQTFSGRRESLRARAAIYQAQIRILSLAGDLSVEQLGRLENLMSE